MGDAYELLSGEHREVETLLRHYAESHDPLLVHQIVDSLRLHDEVEMQVVYREVRRYVDDGAPARSPDRFIDHVTTSHQIGG